MKSQICNKIVALKFFCLFFRNGCLEVVAIFLALVALKCICCVFRFENVSWAGVALKIFFVAFLFEFFFGAYLFENNFLLLLLWKLFLAPVALQNVCRLPLWKLFLFFSLWILFWALVALKIFWYFFENVFLAVIALKILFWHLLFWK